MAIRNSLIPARGGNFLSDLSLMRDELFFPVQETFDRFFHDFFGSDSLFDTVKGKGGYPKMELGTQDNCWVVRAAIPGVKEEDLSLEVDESNKSMPVLRIQGQMSSEYQTPEGAQYFVRELKKSKFVREVTLPKGLEGEPEVVLKDGILTLKWKLPIAVEEAKPAVKKLAIKSE